MNELVMIRGDSQNFVVTLADTAGNPFDLTDVDITFTVDDLFAKTNAVGGGIVVAAPATGIATIEVEPADTADVDGRWDGRYDVQLVLSSGAVKTPLRGRFLILPDVTE